MREDEETDSMVLALQGTEPSVNVIDDSVVSSSCIWINSLLFLCVWRDNGLDVIRSRINPNPLSTR